MTAGTDLAFELADISVSVYRAPIARPLQTAFGMMADRPAVIVRTTDAEGRTGFGEIWSNFPAHGAEHRARLASSILLPEVIDRHWSSPEQVFDLLTANTRFLALQSGEHGPIAQAIAGIDIALWDLVARRAGLPLWRLLGGVGDGRVAAYASGIGPDGAVDQAESARQAGYRAYKLKVGFGREQDLANLRALRRHLGTEASIAIDANQAWHLDEAIAMCRAVAVHRPLWLEEPIAVDSPPDDWQRLAKASPIPLAGGENLRGERAFDAVIAAGAIEVIQPDLAKWGGISKTLPLAKRIMAAGHSYCPHYLGGGVGLMASAHLLAAVGGDGMLEIDSNPNPLREGLAMPYPPLDDGELWLTEAAGLGTAPEAEIERFRVPFHT